LRRGAEDWGFRWADTKELTHGLHPYPARMVPQVARRLLGRYSKPGGLVLDPFCGSGTVLVEAVLLGRRAVGVDVNPLAVLLARVKSKPVEPGLVRGSLRKLLAEVSADLGLLRSGRLLAELPEFPNVRYWFKEGVGEELSVVMRRVQGLGEPRLRALALVCLSQCARRASNIYSAGDTFTKRLREEELQSHTPDVEHFFTQSVNKAITAMQAFYNASARGRFGVAQVLQGDARSLPLPDCSVDAVVTSPPYGEERSTVSYTRWSRVSAPWLGFTTEMFRSASRASLGESPRQGWRLPETLRAALEPVAREDPLLARAASRFFADYFSSLGEMARVLVRGGRCCVVVGDRSLRRRRIPVGAITREMGEALGLGHIKSFKRRIPSKSIPWSVAKGETIHGENIVIMRKQ